MTAATLVPAYIDYGPADDIDPSTAEAFLSSKHLRLPGDWVVQSAYRVTATVGFVAAESVPPWVGAAAMLSPAAGLKPQVVSRGDIPLVYAFASNGSASFQLEVSDVSSSLAAKWKASLLSRISLVPTAIGQAHVAGFGFVLDLGAILLRASYLPARGDVSDSVARADEAQQASSSLLAGLAAA